MGGEPKWRDGGNDTRDEENLNGEAESLAGTTTGGWYTVQVDLEGTKYVADSRDYFIDFDAMVTEGLIKKVPASASTDNPGGSASGSYSWYVDSRGVVNALFYHFPTNGVSDQGTNIGITATNTTSINDGTDNRDFQSGVYP